MQTDIGLDDDDFGGYSFEDFGRRAGGLSRSQIYVVVADPKNGLEVKKIGRRSVITRKSAHRWWASRPSGTDAEPTPLAEARQRVEVRTNS